MPQPPKTLNTIDDLLQITKDLRGPNGCPWDKEQTHNSLTPFAIEETCEMVEAIESGDDSHMCEELGDVLFQVVLHAAMAEERNAFKLSDVVSGISSKLVRRHPHVFSDTNVSGTEEVLKNWEEIKKTEKLGKPQKPTTVFNIPAHLPALQAAEKIGSKTKKIKFDWPKVSEVITQLKAEITELEEAIKTNIAEDIEHEMGDVLFSAAQVARHLKVEPESSLRHCNNRFKKRVDKMIELTKSEEDFIGLPPEQKEELWQKVKTLVD